MTPLIQKSNSGEHGWNSSKPVAASLNCSTTMSGLSLFNFFISFSIYVCCNLFTFHLSPTVANPPYPETTFVLFNFHDGDHRFMDSIGMLPNVLLALATDTRKLAVLSQHPYFIIWPKQDGESPLHHSSIGHVLIPSASK